MTPTAYLVGPGVLRVRNDMPSWEPLNGKPLLLQPERLTTLIVHGAADMTAAALRLLWRHGVQLSFLSRAGNRLLGRVSPPAEQSPALGCWQHWAATDPTFALDQARRIVHDKIVTTQQVAGQLASRKHPELRHLRSAFAGDLLAVDRAGSLASLRGHEGAASARWHAALRTLFPASMPYEGRRHHPPPDPVNALLSLGYTLLLTRVQAALSAVGLDPLVGVYHQMRAGKPALACDLMEPFRASVVDQLVVAKVRQGVFVPEHFHSSARGCRLRKEDFRRFLQAFENRFAATPPRPSFEEQVRRQIDGFAAAVRTWVRKHPQGSVAELTSEGGDW